MPTGYPTTVSTSFLPDRGYTGYSLSRQSGKILDAFGLINMNGRMYDPINARFLSPDPFVQDPLNTQSYNRYSYVFNNPMMYIDPSGYTPEDDKERQQAYHNIEPVEVYGNRIPKANANDIFGEDVYHENDNMMEDNGDPYLADGMRKGEDRANRLAAEQQEKRANIQEFYRHKAELDAIREAYCNEGGYHSESTQRYDTDGSIDDPDPDKGGLMSSFDNMVQFMYDKSDPKNASSDPRTGGVELSAYVFYKYDVITKKSDYKFFILPWYANSATVSENPAATDVSGLLDLYNNGYMEITQVHTENSYTGPDQCPGPSRKDYVKLNPYTSSSNLNDMYIIQSNEVYKMIRGDKYKVEGDCVIGISPIYSGDIKLWKSNY